MVTSHCKPANLLVLEGFRVQAGERRKKPFLPAGLREGDSMMAIILERTMRSGISAEIQAHVREVV
jgi:hypothetical protein